MKDPQLSFSCKLRRFAKVQDKQAQFKKITGMLSKAGYLRSERGQPYRAAGQEIYDQTSGLGWEQKLQRQPYVL